MSNFVNLLDIVYPVGSIYHSMSATSPASTVGGTWTQLKTFLYGSTTAKQTGGEATHILTVDEMPVHNHDTHVAVYASGFGGLGMATSSTNANYYSTNDSIQNRGGGASTQQLAALHDLLHLVPNSLKLSEVAYV